MSVNPGLDHASDGFMTSVEAAERVAAAADAAHAGDAHLVLTARAENYLRANPDVNDIIARLQAYQEAGADVLYAPALDRPEDLREQSGARATSAARSQPCLAKCCARAPPPEARRAR